MLSKGLFKNLKEIESQLKLEKNFSNTSQKQKQKNMFLDYYEKYE